MNAATELGAEGWEKPWSGTGGGNCIELKALTDGRIAIRNSEDPQGPATIHTSAELEAFISGVKAGMADHFLASAP